MKLVIGICIAGLIGALAWSFLKTPVYSWTQQLTVNIETADGPVDIVTVQNVSVAYFEGGQPLAGNEVNYESQGQAGYTQLSDGTYLFSLLKGPNLAEGVYADLRGGSRGNQLKRITRQVGNPPVIVDRKFWPDVVRFIDLKDPETVQPASGNTEYALGFYDPNIQEVRFEIIMKRHLSFEIFSILPWLQDHPDRRLCEPDGRTQDIPLCMNLAHRTLVHGATEN